MFTNGFRGEEFQKSANQKQESPVAAMFVNESGRNEQPLQRIFHRCLKIANFVPIGKQTWPPQAILVSD
jgi:hypothetical protein